VLVTHHLEELPPTITHAALLRDGRCLAAGPVGEVLTSQNVSDCFDHPVRLERGDGRWTVRTARRGGGPVASPDASATTDCPA
jgi:iron complex transport system ATP-binding protein